MDITRRLLENCAGVSVRLAPRHARPATAHAVHNVQAARRTSAAVPFAQAMCSRSLMVAVAYQIAQLAGMLTRMAAAQCAIQRAKLAPALSTTSAPTQRLSQHSSPQIVDQRLCEWEDAASAVPLDSTRSEVDASIATTMTAKCALMPTHPCA